jgi:cytochrome c oxidase cbb3-type subunit III
MDGDWIYGGSEAQIFDSIVSGRANGMPAFGDKLTIEQTWHIVGYVRAFDESETTRDRAAGSGERSR